MMDSAVLVSPIICRTAGLPFDILRKCATEHSGEFELNTTQTDLAVDHNLSERGYLWDNLKNEEFIRAVASIAPQAYNLLISKYRNSEHLSSKNSRIRSLERTLYRYLFRVCARNDTAGSAGSILRGNFSSSNTLNLYLQKMNRGRISTIYPSPVYLDSIVLFGICKGWLRDVRMSVSPKYIFSNQSLIDTLTGNCIKNLTYEELDFIRNIHNSEHLSNSQTASHSIRFFETAKSLIKRGLVSVYLHGHQLPYDSELRLEYLYNSIRTSPDIEKQATLSVLEKLITFQKELNHCSPEKYAHLVEEADILTSSYFQFYQLDRSSLLLSLVEVALSDISCRSKLKFRVSPSFQISENTLIDLVQNKTIAIPSTILMFLQLLDGKTDLNQTLQAMNWHSKDMDSRSITSTIITLMKLGIITIMNHVGSGRYNPFNDLNSRAFLKQLVNLDLPEVYMMAFCSLYDLTAPCRATSYCECILTLQNSAKKLSLPIPKSDRNRSFFIEDSRWEGSPLLIGGRLRYDMEKNIAIFLKHLAYEEYEQDYLRSDIIKNILPSGTSISLAAFLDNWNEVSKQSFIRTDLKKHSKSRIDDTGNQLNEQDAKNCEFEIISHYNENSHTISIEQINYPEPFKTWLQDKRFGTYMDLMVSHPDKNKENYECVINETHTGTIETRGSHPELPTVSFFSNFRNLHSEDNKQIIDNMSEFLGHNSLFIQQRQPTKQADSIYWQLSKLTVARTNSDTIWSNNNEISFADLFIERRDNQVQISGNGKHYRLPGGPLHLGNIRLVGGNNWKKTVMRYFSNSIRHVAPGILLYPQIRLGNFILSRHAAEVEKIAIDFLLGSDTNLLVAGKALQEALGLGRYVFVSLINEKPIYCDFMSQISLEALVTSLKHSRPPFRFTAMKPSPHELWFNSGGSFYTSELRFLTYVNSKTFNIEDSTHYLI